MPTNRRSGSGECQATRSVAPLELGAWVHECYVLIYSTPVTNRVVECKYSRDKHPLETGFEPATSNLEDHAGQEWGGSPAKEASALRDELCPVGNSMLWGNRFVQNSNLQSHRNGCLGGNDDTKRQNRRYLIDGLVSYFCCYFFCLSQNCNYSTSPWDFKFAIPSWCPSTRGALRGMLCDCKF